MCWNNESNLLEPCSKQDHGVKKKQNKFFGDYISGCHVLFTELQYFFSFNGTKGSAPSSLLIFSSGCSTIIIEIVRRHSERRRT